MIHLFINLLGNAARALREHESNRAKVITIRGRETEEESIIEVSDSGPGIPPEILNRVFEPFFTTKDVGSGMGMGLSICHTVMKAHQGSISVANQPDSGAIFTINLPLAETQTTL